MAMAALRMLGGTLRGDKTALIAKAAGVEDTADLADDALCLEFADPGEELLLPGREPRRKSAAKGRASSEMRCTCRAGGQCSRLRS